mgnify:CR=1 FL=1
MDSILSYCGGAGVVKQAGLRIFEPVREETDRREADPVAKAYASSNLVPRKLFPSLRSGKTLTKKEDC